MLGIYTKHRTQKLRLKTQLAIKADIEALPPRAWNRKDVELYLAEQRTAWNAPKYLTPGLLISFLVENEIAHIAEISSKEYGRKTRYVTGDLTLLQFACSFYKNSYLSHATALHVHGLLPRGKVFVNHEQSPKNTTLALVKAASIKRSATSPAALLSSFRLAQPRSPS